MPVFTNVSKKDVAILKKLGFSASSPKTVYEDIRYTKNGVTAILYTSGKLVLQGKEDAVEDVAAQLDGRKIGTRKSSPTFKAQKGTFIGSDESLKGDTFGGITVAAVKADETVRQQLRELGVADSKTLSDKEILKLADQIKAITQCEIKSILPLEYNEFKGNVTKLLDELHRDCAEYLQPGTHVVDKYPGCSVGTIIEEKADQKYVEVAAASILARAAALKQLDMLSVQAGFTVPKGSSHVKMALHELHDRKHDFKRFVKVHFSNVQEMMS